MRITYKTFSFHRFSFLRQNRSLTNNGKEISLSRELKWQTRVTIGKIDHGQTLSRSDHLARSTDLEKNEDLLVVCTKHLVLVAVSLVRSPSRVNVKGVCVPGGLGGGGA